MATTPRPRILPKITYAPPAEPPDTSGLGAGGGAGYNPNRDMPIDQFGRWLGGGINNALSAIFPTGTAWLGDRTLTGSGVGAAGPNMQQPHDPDYTGMFPPPAAPTDYYSQYSQYGQQGMNPIGRGAPNTPVSDQNDRNNANPHIEAGGTAISEPRDSGSWKPATPPPSAIVNNQNNLKAAVAAGDTASIARLQAEWERLKPFATQFNLDPARLVNVYMDPKNPAAKLTLRDAGIAAALDDAWGAQMAAANMWSQDPAVNDLLWKEHWQAMNGGGRDPLEGHPQAIQNLQGVAQTINQALQDSQYSDYQAGLTSGAFK